MIDRFSRTRLLLGEDGIKRLSECKVAIFGIGGVGGHVCEALVRSGVGKFLLVDSDKVSLTNINRQIHATDKTVGRSKVEVMKERMLDINPDAEIETKECFFLPETSHEFSFEEYDYVVDAVDTVTAKLSIIMKAKEAGVFVISAMGAGNKLDPTRFKVADIYETNVCPLAKVMRRELRKRNVDSLKVVFSDEEPTRPNETAENIRKAENEASDAEATSGIGRRDIPGSNAWTPAVMGLIIGGEVVKDLTKACQNI